MKFIHFKKRNYTKYFIYFKKYFDSLLNYHVDEISFDHSDNRDSSTYIVPWLLQYDLCKKSDVPLNGSRNHKVKLVILENNFYRSSEFFRNMTTTHIPETREDLKKQDTTTDVNEEFFQKLFAPPNFLAIHRIYQILCFFLFLGPLKVIAAFFSFLIWVIVMIILSGCRNLFSSKLRFKNWSHSICKIFVRIIMFFLGIFRIKMKGKIDPNVRFYVSNHLTLIDYIIHFISTPITIVKTSESTGIEKYIIGQIFDVFKLKSKKKRAAYQITNCASDPSYFPMLIFPENVPTNGNAVIGFATDAFESEYAAQPVALQYHLHFTPRGFNSLYYGDKNVLSLLFRVLCTPWITCSISYLPKQEMKSGILEPHQLAKKCQLKVANELGVLATSKEMPAKTIKVQ